MSHARNYRFFHLGTRYVNCKMNGVTSFVLFNIMKLLIRNTDYYDNADLFHKANVFYFMCPFMKSSCVVRISFSRLLHPFRIAAAK